MSAPDGAWDLIEERPRILGNPMERGASVWHVAKARGRTSDFVPIRCSTTDEGITLPGYVQRGIPTCPDCRRIVGIKDPL